MTTTTAIRMTDEGAHLLEDHPEPASTLSFDRILELRSIAMDVKLSAHGTEDAADAAADAMAEAQAYAATPTHIATVTQVPVGAVAYRVLAGAARLIRERGWIQGDFDDASGAMCLWGAVRAASANLGGEDAEDAALHVLRRRIGDGDPRDVSVPMWNDARGRTVEDVLRILVP